MARTRGRKPRDLRDNCAAVGYVCNCCGEVYTLVRVAPGPEVEIPRDVGCPSCWGDLRLVEIVNVCGVAMWKDPAGLGARSLLSERGQTILPVML